MDIDVLKQKIEISILELLEKDVFLIRHDVSERSITHKLAIYIAEQFPDYDVDCEYNSNVQNDSGKKYIYLIREKAIELDLLKERDGDDEFVSRIVYPDIIVHKRGLNDSNLLIVEVKKSSSRLSSEYDHEKLARYTSADYENELNYQFGVFIEIHIGNEIGKFKTEWFINGNNV
jgi:hypothetical protein